MASGHVNRANRPNTWLHRPDLQREKVLANSEPSTHGTFEIQSARPNPERNAGDQRKSCDNRVRRSVQPHSEDEIGMCIGQIHCHVP